ncbi:MAG: dephospho-CoA kinase [Chloroflexi bacterium AL-W]|nr:dephospho-CoA kinase [Chloroflexi bacterium AL-N1]NOK70082.1 dephospho-CoA kinase [Chloroflexi bacterium AL-N10]NOK77906.1 dephospho-CoA kinase [Chloroflexi bacterium AL-N5]NOK84915.1 dephospho-CoA kinase [Chloroflexi bacterium AL-W]NOK91894.1 dephospho-CoA kinase [Chloroflexi bacterium AL-N15]
MPNKLYLIGMTGNIACGKSTVLAMLANHGAHVIDADVVVHKLQAPGQLVYDQIVAAFGTDILTEPGGPIDRRQLGAIVFAHPDQLRKLEQIVHPAVRAHNLAWLEEVRQQGGGVAVIDAIKLLESGWKTHCDAVWVVTCQPEQQLERLMQDRGMSEEESRTRMAAQPPQSEKVAQADVVIDNSGTLGATQQQVYAAWEAIKGLV